MPRLLNFRPLCGVCECAEATTWSRRTRQPLCRGCNPDDEEGHRVSPVVAALCATCNLVPAYAVDRQMQKPICAECGAGRDVVSMKECVVLGKNGDDEKGKGASASANNGVDLSYFKTQVPSCLVDRKKAKRDSKGKKEELSVSRRRKR